MRFHIAVAALSLCIPASAATAADKLFEQAVRYQQSGQLQEAEQAYRSYLKQYGPTPEALANLGAVLVRGERFTEAVDAYSRALKLAPGSVPILVNLGLAYFKAGQLGPAVTQFSAVLEKAPQDARVRQLRAMSLLELERYEEAARDYSSLLAAGDANIKMGLALAYLRLGKADEAKALIEPLMETDTAEAKLLVGQFLVEQTRFEEAKAALTRAASLNPSLPTVHLHLGAIAWRQQDTVQAIAEWRKELELHPESFQANYTLGAALSMSPDHGKEALPLLRKAVALQPNSSLATFQLAKLIWQSARSQEAVSLLERCVKIDANHRKAHYLLASIYQSLGRKEEASKEFSIVRKISADEQRRSQDLFDSAQ